MGGAILGWVGLWRGSRYVGLGWGRGESVCSGLGWVGLGWGGVEWSGVEFGVGLSRNG